LLNPAALTQHGVAIISSAIKATIQGLGWRSCAAGLDALIDRCARSRKRPRRGKASRRSRRAEQR